MRYRDFDLHAAPETLVRKTEVLRDMLLARLCDKKSSAFLPARTGTHSTPIQPAVDEEDSVRPHSIRSPGISYSPIQEFGGKAAAFAIVAKNSKALVFTRNSPLSHKKSATHPGFAPLPRSYLWSTPAKAGEEIRPDLKQAILNALTRG